MIGKIGFKNNRFFIKMELKNNVKTFYASSRQMWRDWLLENHKTEKSIWLIIYKKDSNIPTVFYPEAVDEALCFGWIDSSISKRDAESYYQFFAKRNPKSNWSKVNKEKINYLTAQNLMTEEGLKMVEIAQKTGTWNALDDVENLILPQDLKEAFEQNILAKENWEKKSRSYKRGILELLFNAKTETTRQKRIEKIMNDLTF